MPPLEEDRGGLQLDPSRAIRRAFLSAGLGLAVVLLAIVAVGRTDLGDEGLRDLASRVTWWPLLLAWGFLSGALLFVGLRWRELMPRPHYPPIPGLISIQCSGMLLNYAVPGPFGEVASAWFASRRYAVPFADGLAAGVAGRVLGLTSAAALAVGCWALFDLPVPEGWNGVVGLVAMCIGLGGLAFASLALRPDRVRAWGHAILGRFAGMGLFGRLARSLDLALGASADALGGLANRGVRSWSRAIGWSFLGHFSVAAGIGMAAWSLGAPLSVPGLLFAHAAATSAVVLLYAAPGSHVAWDALLVGMLVAAAGMPVPDALAVALVVRVLQITTMVLGAVALVWLHRATSA
jgi:hypothetical protein